MNSKIEIDTVGAKAHKPVASGTHNKVIYNIDQLASTQLVEWGPQPDSLPGNPQLQSHSRGLLLYKGSDNEPGTEKVESGFWECTPGSWKLAIPRDEFCHFIAGRATYTPETGDSFEVNAGTCVHFKAGWRGTCTVHATIRNAYMLTA